MDIYLVKFIHNQLIKYLRIHFENTAAIDPPRRHARHLGQ